MKGFHVPSTRTTNSVRLILGSQYSLCVQLHQTSPSALRAETSSRYQLASHAGVFRVAPFSSLYEKRAPLKTPAWEARYPTDLPENQIWHTDEAGASLACYQSTLISETSFFSLFPLVWAKYKWNFMRDHRCKLSFPLPLAASPLARAFSRDSPHSPR